MGSRRATPSDNSSPGASRPRAPHVHYALLYKSPGSTLDAATLFYAARSDGSDLAGVWPWSWYPGAWPWRSRPGGNLGIDSTFFCPYAFSSPAAKAAMDTVPALALEDWPCACPCAYESSGGDCGSEELCR